MKLTDRIIAKQSDLFGERQPVIAFLGDSVTQGCFEIYVKNEKLETKTRSTLAYHEKLREILAMLYPDVPINIINAGISGDCAKNAKNRLDRDCLSYNPDLVVVCFGLNDSMQGKEGIEDYKKSLAEIFEKIQKSGSDVIFMTPNMRTRMIDEPFSEKILADAAESVVKNEGDHWLDTYIYAARAICREYGVSVCDCNRIWKALVRNGVNLNSLLSNRINHPTEDMHWLFAYELARMIFDI